MKKKQKALIRKDPQMAISIAESFDELYSALKTIEQVKGSEKGYSPQQLIKIIERVRHLHQPLNFITQTHGIRDSVERLLADDREYLKALEQHQKKGNRRNRPKKRAA